MSSILKYVAILLFVALFGAWFMQVFKSCNTSKAATTFTESLDDATDAATDLVDGDSDVDLDETDLEDLYDEEEEMDEILAEAEKDESLLDESDEEDSDADDDADGATDDNDEGEATLASSDNDENTKSSTSSYSSRSGDASSRYLVVAGAFISKNGAQRTLNQLDRLGYDDSEIVKFDFSEYHSVCVDRFRDEGSARRLSRELKAKGIEAYVHKKRKMKKKS